MFIAAKRSVSRPPSGGPCQPTLWTIKQWPPDVAGSASQPRQHCPPDGGRERPRNRSINIALLTEGPTTNHRLPSSDVLATRPTFNHTRPIVRGYLSLCDLVSLWRSVQCNRIEFFVTMSL